jgi:hypothetical protein
LARYLVSRPPEDEEMPPNDPFTVHLLLLTLRWLVAYDFLIARSSRYGVTGEYKVSMLPMEVINSVVIEETEVLFRESPPDAEPLATAVRIRPARRETAGRG